MNLIASSKIILSENEVSTILKWHENSTDRKSRFGSVNFVFPQEQILLTKIKKAENSGIEIDEFELEMLTGWMENALFPKLGQKTYLFPFEESAISKIDILTKSINAKKIKIQKYLSSRKMDLERRENIEKWESEKLRLEYEKAALKAIDEKISRLNIKFARLQKDHEERKNRSIDEKIAASNKLKSELDIIRRQLKF